MAADDFCYLTTTGRRTGRPHRIEIWYARARVVSAGDEGNRARTQVFDKYEPRSKDDLTGWRERASPVAIDLAPSNGG